MYIMSDKMNRKWDLPTSISELESVGLETPKLNELNDSYEVENLVENLKQTKDYKSMHVFTDLPTVILNLLLLTTISHYDRLNEIC